MSFRDSKYKDTTLDQEMTEPQLPDAGEASWYLCPGCMLDPANGVMG